MSIEFQILLTLFFGVFETTGGIWMGLGAKRLIAGEPQVWGSIILGLIWSGATTFVCAVFFYPINPWLLYLQIALLGAVTIGCIVVPNESVARIGSGTIIAITLGSVVTVIGLGVGIETFRRQEEVRSCVKLVHRV